MTGSTSTRIPDDPLHPDHAIYARLLNGVSALGRWNPTQCENLAAALYADLRTKQPRMQASDLGRILAGDHGAERPSLFAAPRADYHSHTSDPASLLFSARLDAAARPASRTLAPFARQTSIDMDGFLTDPGMTRTPISRIEHAAMPHVNGIVLHRTDSSTADGTLATWRSREAGTGAHFLIDHDGTIHQTVRVDRQAWHVGAIRSRAEVDGTITPEDQRELVAARNGQAEWRGTAVRAVSRLESTRPYPERYPTNADSIGIEVVGRYHPATETWDAPTSEQAAAIKHLMEALQRNFGLTDRDVYQHDAISRKTPGEGAGLYAPGEAGLPSSPADTDRMPSPAPQR